MQLLNMESLMQSEFGDSYQIALGIKGLSIDHLHTQLREVVMEKQYVLQRSQAYEKYPLLKNCNIKKTPKLNT